MASSLKQPTELLKPAPLRPGDRVAVVAPAGPVHERALAGGIKVLESLGFRAVLGTHLRERRGYLAGNDEARAEDLNAALRDPEVRGIICARGGYGTGRILPLVDYAAARNDPKVVVGYSDVTALHLALGRQAGLVTFHGPMVESLGAKLTRLSLDCLVRAVTTTEPLDILPMPDDYPSPRVMGAGRVTAPLTGGNLSLIAALVGTPYEIETKGRVLLLEDINEEPYRVDRMLCQLGLAGKLAPVSGVALGEMVGCEYEPPANSPEEPDTAPAASLTLDETLTDHLAGLGKPILTGLPCGHGRDKWTVPLGVMVTVDAYKARFIVEEAGCQV